MQSSLKPDKVERFDPAQRRQRISTYFRSPLLLDISSLELTDRQMEKLFVDNGDLHFEVTAKGELVIMAPSGDYVAVRENELAFQVTRWAKKDGSGIAYGATGGFHLPMGLCMGRTFPG